MLISEVKGFRFTIGLDGTLNHHDVMQITLADRKYQKEAGDLNISPFFFDPMNFVY